MTHIHRSYYDLIRPSARDLAILAFRWIRRALLVVLASIAATASALACSCGSDLEGGIPQASFIGASLIAPATMIGTEFLPGTRCNKHSFHGCGPRRVGIFVVGEPLKGLSRSLIRIAFDHSLCAGPVPRLGQKSWVAVTGDEEVGYFFSTCMYFGGPPAEGDDGPLAQTIAQYRSQ